MKKQFSVTLLAGILVSFIFLTSCTDYYFNSIQGDGVIVTEERSIGTFEGVELLGEFDVYISHDSNHTVTVEAESSLVPYIVTGVRNGNLVIKSKDNVWLRNTRSMKVFISMDLIEKLKIAGSGDIKTYDYFVSDELDINISGSGDMKLQIDADYVEIDISGSGNIDLETNALEVDANITGSGDIDLYGSSVETDFTISGSGKINAVELPTDFCETKITGSGSNYVHVSQLLDVHISGSGDVFYKGDPTLNTHITGTGSVIKL